MHTQKCTTCKTIKSDVDFAWKNKQKQIKHSYCKECQNKRSKLHYNNNKNQYILRAVQFNKKQRQKNKKFIKEYLKQHFCVDCGNSDYRVLEFDHLYDKKYNISDMIQQSYCIKTIQLEIDKCEIRCANCHRIKHYENRPGAI